MPRPKLQEKKKEWIIVVLSKQPRSAAADHFIIHSHHGDCLQKKYGETKIAEKKKLQT
jgi:hypothetical protein